MLHKCSVYVDDILYIFDNQSCPHVRTVHSVQNVHVQYSGAIYIGRDLEKTVETSLLSCDSS